MEFFLSSRFPIVSSHAADKHILGPLPEDKVGQVIINYY